MAEQTYTAVEINCETGEVIERLFTEEEIAQAKADEALWLEQKAQAEAEMQALAEAKASALAKLTALGLSEDEAKAIVG